MQKIKLVIGIILIPIAFAIWVLDRIIMSVMPQNEHKAFKTWLESDTIGFAIGRILTVILLRALFYWLFGV